MTKKNKKKKPAEPGQEININFKKNRGTYPNSEEALDKDLIDTEIYQTPHKPPGQEWPAREDSQRPD